MQAEPLLPLDQGRAEGQQVRPGSNPTKNSWDASRDGDGTTYGDYIKAYQKQFQDICGPEYVPELVIFDYALAGGAPFKPLA